MEFMKKNNMSNITLVHYSDSSSDEEQPDNILSIQNVQSSKKIAVVQPTLQGHIPNQNLSNSSELPPAPSNSPVTNSGQQQENDENDPDDVAHILLDLAAEGRTRGNSQHSGNESPLIEISSSPLYDPEEEEILDAEIIEISSDSDTIPHQQPQSPVSEDSQPFDMYNEFNIIISDNSCTTGENLKIFN